MANIEPHVHRPTPVRASSTSSSIYCLSQYALIALRYPAGSGFMPAELRIGYTITDSNKRAGRSSVDLLPAIVQLSFPIIGAIFRAENWLVGVKGWPCDISRQLFSLITSEPTTILLFSSHHWSITSTIHIVCHWMSSCRHTMPWISRVYNFKFACASRPSW